MLKMKYAEPWILRVAAIVAVVCILIWLGSLVVVYWGVEYASPPWDERSVPAPRTY
jgi:putative copper export protein